MEVVGVSLGERTYEIRIGSGSLGLLGDELKKFALSRRIAIITNPTVYGLYGERVFKSLNNAGFDAVSLIIPDGERYKDLLWANFIYGELLKHRLDRSSALIALGGGVIGDITGFVASTYMRGISYIQAPTTLMAAVDSSVGGKTGVNHRLGKNMIGTFWQPRLVWIDTDALKTLPQREFIAGMAEVIKYGVIWDEELFEFLEDRKDDILALKADALNHIIRRSCGIKAEVVSKDEREAGLRAILNYGHTIGHAIETVTGYEKYLHGEAVAIGMCLEARLSEAAGLLKGAESIRIKNLIASYGLPAEMPEGINPAEMFEAMAVDKKAVEGKLTFILPERIGSVKIHKATEERAVEALLKGL